MNKYFIVFRLALQDILEYKLDFFLHSAKYSMMICLMAFVWIAVQNEGGNNVFSTSQTVTYFFFAAILYSLSNFHPWFVEDDIRLGHLSKYLVKPISATLYYYSFLASSAVIETLIKAVVFLPLLFIFQINMQTDISHVGLFLLFLPLIFTCSYFLLTSISLLAFWVTEAYAIRWGASIIFRFLAGALMPIIYFPTYIQTATFYLPFQHLIFTPIQIVTNQMSFQRGLTAFGILLVWTLVLGFIRQRIWKLGLCQFEGTGM